MMLSSWMKPLFRQLSHFEWVNSIETDSIDCLCKLEHKKKHTETNPQSTSFTFKFNSPISTGIDIMNLISNWCELFGTNFFSVSRKCCPLIKVQVASRLVPIDEYDWNMLARFKAIIQVICFHVIRLLVAKAFWHYLASYVWNKSNQ